MRRREQELLARFREIDARSAAVEAATDDRAS